MIVTSKNEKNSKQQGRHNQSSPEKRTLDEHLREFLRIKKGTSVVA